MPSAKRSVAATTASFMPGSPGLAYDDEFATGPMLSEAPWCDERPSEVPAAVNQDAGNARKEARFSQENTIFEPIVAPIVGDDAGKRQPEGGFLVARMRRVVRMHRYEGHLPVAPVSRGLLVYGWIGVHEEAMIGFNEVAGNLRFGHAVTKTCPLLWEENANSTGYPVELSGCVSGDADKHHFSHSMGMPFGVSERQGRSPRPAKHQPPLNICGSTLKLRLRSAKSTCWGEATSSLHAKHPAFGKYARYDDRGSLLDP
jgi:hypothetical protein